MERSGELERLEWETMVGMPPGESSVSAGTFRSVLAYGAQYRRKALAARARDQDAVETNEGMDMVETSKGPNSSGASDGPTSTLHGLRSEHRVAPNHGGPTVDGNWSPQVPDPEDVLVEHDIAAGAGPESRDSTPESSRDGDSRQRDPNSWGSFRSDLPRDESGHAETTSTDSTDQLPIGRSESITDRVGTDKAAKHRSEQTTGTYSTDSPPEVAYSTQQGDDDDFNDYDAGVWYS